MFKHHVCIYFFVFSHVQLFVASWTIYPTRLLCPWKFPGKNTGAGCHFLLQEIFPTQGSNPCLAPLLHGQADTWPLAPPEKPCLDLYPQSKDKKKSKQIPNSSYSRAEQISKYIVDKESQVSCCWRKEKKYERGEETEWTFSWWTGIKSISMN